MNTLPVCMYVYFLDIVPALSCLHLSTHTHHGPTHSSFVFVLFIHIVSCSCMSICQSCDHVPPCLFHYVCQPFCLCCPVLSCCVGLSTHHWYDRVSWEWMHSGLAHLRMMANLVYTAPVLLRFSQHYSVWQLIQNAQLWLAESLWGFRLHTFHSVWSFEHVACWEQDLAVMNFSYVILRDDKELKCFHAKRLSIALGLKPMYIS